MSNILYSGICQSSNCSSLVFNDTTGAYSSDNQGGYGTPNKSTSGASAEIIFTLADGNSYTVALPNTFPTTDSTVEYTIAATDLGYSSTDQIADQIISYQYKVTFSDTTTATQNGQASLYCQVNCCVNSMFIDLDINCDDCLKSLGERAMEAHLMLQGLKYSASCGNSTAFNKTLTQLNKLCQNSECSSCG
jgi:hypothetical protein